MKRIVITAFLIAEYLCWCIFEILGRSGILAPFDARKNEYVILIHSGQLIINLFEIFTITLIVSTAMAVAIYQLKMRFNHDKLLSIFLIALAVVGTVSVLLMPNV